MRESRKDANTQSGPPQAPVRSRKEAAKRRRRGGRRSVWFAAHRVVRMRGRHLGAEALEEDWEPFEEQVGRLRGALREQPAEGRRLDEVSGKALGGVGW